MTGKLTMLVVLGVLAMAGSAGAQAMNQQFDLSGQVFVEPGDPTCPTGTFGTDTFTYDNGFEHITMKPDGTFHVNGTGEGEFEQQPYLDPTVPTCTGHFAFWCGAKVAADGVTLLDDQFTVDMHAYCTDGSTINTHWTGKLQMVDGVLHKNTGTFTCH
jgi:hypothetical protein